MYAVIRTGGKQYRVAEGDVIRIEKIAGDTGAEVQFEEVLMLGGTDSPKVGKPTVAGARVKGTILRQTKARRVVHFRKEKEGWTRMRGHRQPFTEIKITGVSA
ncbi:MAG: 50S ribosomal protein L21 [Myxococcaceae bacterium]|jgi:large subunit ribosomal protein L21|nr:50S ribosomal protein L21 [Myxococcaceae bacterium]MCA3013549.1 50S ribosomal protein L21 [Myxococcaceae bacterium]